MTFQLFLSSPTPPPPLLADGVKGIWGHYNASDSCQGPLKLLSGRGEVIDSFPCRVPRCFLFRWRRVCKGHSELLVQMEGAVVQHVLSGFRVQVQGPLCPPPPAPASWGRGCLDLSGSGIALQKLQPVLCGRTQGARKGCVSLLLRNPEGTAPGSSAGG